MFLRRVGKKERALESGSNRLKPMGDWPPQTGPSAKQELARPLHKNKNKNENENGGGRAP